MRRNPIWTARPDRFRRRRRVKIAARLAYNRDGGVRFIWAIAPKLLRQRQILAASIGQFAGNRTLVFFLTWFPTYMEGGHESDATRSSLLRALPYIAASAGVLLALAALPRINVGARAADDLSSPGAGQPPRKFQGRDPRLLAATAHAAPPLESTSPSRRADGEVRPVRGRPTAMPQ